MHGERRRPATNCLVVSEDPAGEGFGDAALRLSLLYKMKPVAKDGRPTSGGMIRVPMRFQRPPPAPVSTAVPHIKVAAADWGRIPDAKDLARAYPPAALGAHLEGLGVMRCTFTATGDLRDCAVVSESPTGYGFGDAALKLAKDFRLKSPVHEGIPVAGTTIDIPLRFRLPG